MAEYIEREAARTLFAGYGSTDQFDALLDTIPAADVVEVVRCGECEYYQDNNGGYPHPECRWNPDETPDADDFCSYGRRREDSE